jgi:hypothetical protein
MMQFTSQKKNNNEIIIQTNNNYNILSRIPLQRRIISSKSIEPKVEGKKDVEIVNHVNTPKKMKWGEPTWFLFHTLAYKVKDEYFRDIRVELLNNIYSICVNLPCPLCANHAREYMNKINFNSITNKEDLKSLLFHFHNEVNKKKNYSQFPYSELDDKYSKAITINIIQNFMGHFEEKNKSPNMISNDFHRKRLINTLKDWFNKNIQYFDR